MIKNYPVKYCSPFHWDITSTFIIQYSTFDIKIFFAIKCTKIILRYYKLLSYYFIYNCTNVFDIALNYVPRF
jgi:hypothetical protein